MKRTILVFFFLIFANTAIAETEISFSEDEAAGADAIAAGIFSTGVFSDAATNLDEATGGQVTRAIQLKDFKGEPGDTLVIPGPVGIEADYIILYGLGSGEERPSKKTAEDIGGAIATAAIGQKARIVNVRFTGAVQNPINIAYLGLGAKLSSYRFEKYKRPETEGLSTLSRVIVTTDHADQSHEFYDRELRPVAHAIFFARDLINEPANVIYPETFVERTREAATGLDVQIEVLDVSDMRRLGMGALIGVGQGSAHPPRLLIVRYQGNGSDNRPVVFAGKGITFDSGGISLKNKDGMWRMKNDMSGAAGTIGAVLALAGRDAKVNAIGIAALAENMPDGEAQVPGDVVTTMSGKTIEIISTDAEGRLVLSDAVWYAQETFDPLILVDMATLTGSIVTALGDEYGGLFSNDEALAANLIEAGVSSGEELWRMPMHPSYAKDINSDVADIKNGGVKEAGAGIGAQVIGTFIQDDTVWAHLDIAGVAWRFDALPTVPKGGAGFGIRLLNDLVGMYYEGR